MNAGGARIQASESPKRIAANRTAVSVSEGSKAGRHQATQRGVHRFHGRRLGLPQADRKSSTCRRTDIVTKIFRSPCRSVCRAMAFSVI